MKCVILQPSYIPWRGYFEQIFKADLFIYYDDVQYDKNGWRNRNIIKTKQGLRWLTIPVHTKGVIEKKKSIKEIEISWDKPWNEHHWRGIQYAYSKSPFFSEYRDFFFNMYQEKPTYLSDFTIQTTIDIARLMGITHTIFLRSSELKGITGEKSDRLISILHNVGAHHYISGPSAKDYIDTEKFKKAKITLEFMVYDYPEYNQLYPPYQAQVSIIDLIFMQGPQSLNFIINKIV